MQTAELTYHQQRAGVIAHWLVWVQAGDPLTESATARGFWTGDDDVTITIDGVARQYAGAGALQGVQPIVEETGLAVRMLRVELTDVDDVRALLRGLIVKAQPVEIHRAVFDLETRALVVAPELRFAGTVDETPMETGAVGGSSRFGIVIASLTRGLTRLVPLFKSDAALQSRAPGDEFRKYAATTTKWVVPWGEEQQ